MKYILFKVEKFARERTNKFIIYLLIIASIGFYLGFILGRFFSVQF
jgi:hypothetical protein